ncbi:hypothetical protein KSP39_PZI004012 [Platanthera zijinensis]|uniref:Uncharacterized protein n=1 Tax=Platanthera zijinensis TaxID=2320716 RepID=A0AAP0BXC9_9ASPA
MVKRFNRWNIEILLATVIANNRLCSPHNLTPASLANDAHLRDSVRSSPFTSSRVPASLVALHISQILNQNSTLMDKIVEELVMKRSLTKHEFFHLVEENGKLEPSHRIVPGVVGQRERGAATTVGNFLADVLAVVEVPRGTLQQKAADSG